jgi:hypothetical protein
LKAEADKSHPDHKSHPGSPCAFECPRRSAQVDVDPGDVAMPQRMKRGTR